MRAFRECWICTVQSRYVAMMKSGERTLEVRTRIPRGMREGDGLYIMEKGTYTLGLVVRIGSITTYDRSELYLKFPRYELARTCMSLEELEEYLKGRPKVNFIGITPVWIPTDEQRKYLTPDYYGLRCMPQGILPLTRRLEI